MIAIKRALISVSDKTGVLEFSRQLIELGVEILSTGGTAKLLAEAGLPVIQVSQHTGFPEMLDGRIKSLHPRIHGGILARRDLENHLQQLQAQDIPLIDLVVVNLYPFRETVKDPNCDLSTAMENVDIGGPTLLRAAAKNHQSVVVLVNQEDYQPVMDEISSGSVTPLTRQRLAAKAFRHSAEYESAIADWLGKQESAIDQEQPQGQQWPEHFQLPTRLHQVMRYGENPHQNAAFYVEEGAQFGIGRCEQLQGKELSFNNVLDADTALEAVNVFADTACVIVKHANPCGVALGQDPESAYRAAYKTDTTSAFGGIIAFNRTLDGKAAQAIRENQFVEVIIAPTFSKEALLIFSDRPNVRLLEGGGSRIMPQTEVKRVNGGLLVQDKDLLLLSPTDMRLVTKIPLNEKQTRDLRFSWQLVRYLKSNAIVICHNATTVGIGAGQMSRIDSCRIALQKAADAGLETRGAVLASDAFFPFRDSIDWAAGAGIAAVIQPGGSMRDQEVIDAANEHGIAMVFTGTRQFRH